MSPAPTKNPNIPNKVSSNTAVPNSNSSSFHNPSTSSGSGGSSSGGRSKQTGTVPKATTTAAAKISSSTTNKQQSVNPEVNDLQQQQQQPHKPILQQPAVVAQQHLSNRCSPLNIVASIQQQQQHARNQHPAGGHHHHLQQQLHKNTEIVAPIRRELKDLNDYLLTTVVTTSAANTITNNNSTLLQQQQSSGGGAAAASSDIESSQENQQRFCYPVRPIPRRNQPPQVQNQQQQQLQNDFLNTAAANVGNTNLNTTIGVVIPHTPGVPPAPTQSSNNAASTVAAAAAAAPAIPTVQPIQPSSNIAQNITQTINDNQAVLGAQFEQQIQLIVLQRLRQLFENSQTSPFLNLTTSLLPGIQASSSAALANTILNHNTNEISQLAQRFQILNNNQKPLLDNSLAQAQPQKCLKAKTSAMVHEINPSPSGQHEVVVNSTSLEDVPQSNMSDRAQSIQSLHSNIETPTPDTTPSYEELQARLEASNRNIQNMQEQQQQLLKLQNAAKQHLSDMERLRQQAGTLSFATGGTSDGAPDYESVGQVQSDVANLVGRMKNLTSFIQNQNDLSSMLGEDCPEILAEQQVLQRKLEALRAQRDEMRNLVSELQSVNRTAEESAKEARQRQFEQEKDIEENNDHQEQASAAAAPLTQSKKATDVEREVPVEFTRNVPIELLQHAQRPRPQMNGNEASEAEETDMDEDERKETAHLIQQKVADIEAMKAQLKRLKDMMETVSLIEAHTGKDESRTPTREVPIVYDRERTPIAMPSRYNDSNGNEEVLARKVRMLNEVTSDLRAQAQSLQAEKDRINLLKEEIERRKQQAAAAVQLGDDALKRNSLTPTPVPQQSAARTHEERWEEHLRTQHERDALKEEYERKKKEFEVICKRLEQEETPSQQQAGSTGRQDIVSEADDEAEEDNMESDYAESAKFVPTSTPATSRNNESNSNARTGKDSLNSTGVSSNAGTHIAQAASSSAHDGASLEGASMQSGSSRSFSIPPPMSAMGINFPGPIPPPLPTAWNPYYYATGVPPPPPPPPQASYGLAQSAGHNVTLSNSECICTANNLGHAATTSSSTATSAATNNGTLASDPMLQQFIQTQQMLINSVCQCNQMLWHQQREIDNLNQTIHILQERIISLGGGGGGAVGNNEVGGGYTLRSESVPPPSLGGIPATQALPNNLYMTINRAQSEQPASMYIPTVGQQRNNGYGSYQQQQQQQHHQHHVYRRVSQQPHHSAPGAGYNFSAETQQHNSSSSASASMFSTLNNATVPPQPAATTLFNNEIPTPPSPVVGSSGGPAPIFMHHHNNSIHQNNANLRTQNQQQQHHHSNIAGNSTLNNQVPPGNRANNYWDNFRSYSRQNLLSTNSNKSNEEQQQMLQQQQQQQQQQETNSYDRSQAMQQQPQQQQQHPSQQAQIFHEQNLNLEDCVNNLNFSTVSPNNEAASKYLRILQRSRINQQQQQLQYQQNSYQQQQQRELQQLNWLEQQHHENNNSSSNTATSGGTNANNATNSNATDLMYHNYNIQQNNKIGPKPNWRFRNLNEDYNVAINRIQARQSLPRYQNTGFAAGPQYLNLHQSSSPQANRNHDFLLHVQDEDGFNFLNSNHHQQQQQMPLDYSTSNAQNIMPPEACHDDDNNEEDEEEDDTTSEEIKRNLLVNALKNDKFTTKFYESIKEDVFRRLESMLLDKDNVQAQATAAAGHPMAAPQLFNNISSSHHPLRKLNLNEQRDQLQQQLQQQQQTISSSSANYENANLQQQNVSDDSNANARNDYFPANGNNEDNNQDNENEKPEEDTNWRQNNINNSQAQPAAAVPSAPSTATGVNTNSVAKNCSKKRKNLRKQPIGNNNTVSAPIATKEEEQNENLRGACSLAAQQHHKQQQQQVNKDKQNAVENANSMGNNTATTTATANPPSQTTNNEGDLIKYIISRIRNQTHPNTLINDTLLVEVAKLTASVAQNAHNTTCQNNNTNGNIISPKKIYTKIKKLTIPKERDEFLQWYQHYLENTLFGTQTTTNDIKVKAVNSAKTTNNHSMAIQQNGTTPHHSSEVAANATTQQDDGDLAEADQNCSSNTSANYHKDDDEAEVSNCEIPGKMLTSSDENNLEGACALVTSSTNPNQLEDLQAQAMDVIEKKDIKLEKQDCNEKD
ncbi:uncharacterized protein LOC101891600 [Musca domestica]|uniref:Uncharacterized protein LOC101891600 n=1 Tax=Musca domestica TaxID=7370 RepID=A0A9J7CX50_MUSDO|nr:uncharacterized protein LOC101891600 [Musca domestica]